jgi:pyrroloquinoline quinone biosynthesis protein B
MKHYYIFLIVIVMHSCVNKQLPEKTYKIKTNQILHKKSTSLIVLGTIQDAGSPHIACKKKCCKNLFSDTDMDRQVVALGLVDNNYSKKYLFEATPDIAKQMKALLKDAIQNKNEMVDGIFLTHAHIGHYSGLMYLGKEAANAKNVNVFAMPRMKKYLETNGPWSQLVTNKNISLTQIEKEQSIFLTPNLMATPFLVPHRDEYSETVGYRIKGPNKTALFIPDIDKWNKWDKSIVEEIKKVDYAFLDATFYDESEVNRDMSEIPHPFVIETVKLFENLDIREKRKITFIHFNHTNPLLDLNSPESDSVLEKGFNIATFGEEFAL